ATLALTDESAAEQFSPAEGIALVQVTTLPDGDVQLAITGTDAPPAAQINAQANNLVFSVLPGIASAVTSDPEAIRVVVTATRTEEEITDVPRTVRVIEREEIEQQLEFTTNLNTVLGQLLPGFSPPPLRDGARGFTLRGRGVQVLVDGIPQNPNAFSNGELDTFSLDSLERIEVVPGASALYGDGAAGGTINLITRAPLEEAGVLYNVNVGASLPLTNLSTDAGFSYSGGIDIAGSDGRSDGRISLNYDEVNASFDADGNRIIPVSGLNEFDRLALLVKVGHDFDENQRIGLTYGFYRDTPDTEFGSDTSIFEIPGTQIARPIFIGDFDYERSPGRITNVVNLTYRNTDIFGSQLDAQVYFNNFEDVATFGDIRDRTDLPDLFPDLFQNFFELTEIGTRVQVDTPLGDTANLLWGIDYSQEDNQGSAAVLDIPAFDANRELNIVEEFTTIDYELENLGLFAQARWDITDQFQISGGLRYDDISFDANDFIAVFVREDELPRERQGGSGGFDDVSFNAGLLYRPIPEVGLFANFSQGFSVPNVLRGLDNGPTFNPDNIQLEPITVDNYEIGVRAEFDTIQASIAGFYSESDLGASLRFDSDTGLTTLDRAPQRNYGVEVAVDWQPSDFWRLGGNFTWSEGENDRNDDGDFEPLTSLSVPPIKVGLYVENRTTPRWSNRLQLLFVGDRDRAFDEGVDRFEVESYFSLDLLSTLKIGSSGRLTLGLENLLNSDDLVLNSQERVSVFEDRRFARPGITASLRYSVEF
ncbi:MAG: TonB-dependent receptor, partial [Cyanobacteria bacterium P01_C01_bin.70]